MGVLILEVDIRLPSNSFGVKRNWFPFVGGSFFFLHKFESIIEVGLCDETARIGNVFFSQLVLLILL